MPVPGIILAKSAITLYPPDIYVYFNEKKKKKKSKKKRKTYSCDCGHRSFTLFRPECKFHEKKKKKKKKNMTKTRDIKRNDKKSELSLLGLRRFSIVNKFATNKFKAVILIMLFLFILCSGNVRRHEKTCRSWFATR